MFIQKPEGFCDFDLTNAPEFVEYWRQFYRDRVTIIRTDERIDYFAEIDPAEPLTVEKVRRLLRWKDHKFLTHVTLTGPNAGRANTKVERITNDLALLNGFRNGEISESAMIDWTGSIFRSPNLWVWRLFLLHVARPVEYPIMDQHVLRSYRCHTIDNEPLGLSVYRRYRAYFRRIVGALDQSAESPVVLRKHVDDALFVFGQFLKRYLETRSGAARSQTRANSRRPA